MLFVSPGLNLAPPKIRKNNQKSRGEVIGIQHSTSNIQHLTDRHREHHPGPCGFAKGIFQVDDLQFDLPLQFPVEVCNALQGKGSGHAFMTRVMLDLNLSGFLPPDTIILYFKEEGMIFF